MVLSDHRKLRGVSPAAVNQREFLTVCGLDNILSTDAAVISPAVTNYFPARDIHVFQELVVAVEYQRSLRRSAVEYLELCLQNILACL